MFLYVCIQYVIYQNGENLVYSYGITMRYWWEMIGYSLEIMGGFHNFHGTLMENDWIMTWLDINNRKWWENSNMFSGKLWKISGKILLKSSIWSQVQLCLRRYLLKLPVHGENDDKNHEIWCFGESSDDISVIATGWPVMRGKYEKIWNPLSSGDTD
jgi:hypothetical protein